MSQPKLWRPAIEFNLTEHCNLSCAHCDHSSFMLPAKFASLEQFSKDIAQLSQVLHARELKFAGGEPLLHPELLDFIRVARASGIADSIVLITNGVLLHKAPEELWELIDGMWISLYPNIYYRFSWDQLQKIANKHKIWIWRKQTPMFVENLVTQEIQNPKLVDLIYQKCDRAHLYSCHTVYEGRYYICAPSVFAESRLSQSGQRFSNKAADSVALHDNPNLYDALDKLISRQTPLEACRYCLGSFGKAHPHRQLTKKGVAEFLEMQDKQVLGDLIDPLWVVPSSYLEPSG